MSNNSFWNNSQGSPGFVYFNTSASTAENTADTSDFLSFGESPQSKSFTPSNYSSPQKYHSPRNHNSSRNWKQNRYSGQNRSQRQSWGNRSNSYCNQESFDDDILQYLHPSFMEDPWAKLEQELQNKSSTNSEQNDQ